MSTRAARGTVLVCGVLAAGVLAGCRNPDAPGNRERTGPAAVSPGGPGEPPAPPPPAPAAQVPRGDGTAERALRAFASLYIDWTYRTLTAHQAALARMSVGAARLAEQQAAAADTADPTIARGRIVNTGTVIALTPDGTRPGWWVLVTREQTTGSSGYQGLGPSWHVTLARVARVPGGWAVSEWLPQS